VHRIRFLLARHPLLSRLPTLAAALALGWLTTTVIDGATSEVRRLGPMVTVPVSARAVDAGVVLADDDLAWRQVPRGVLPTGDVARTPVGATTLVPLAEGEVLLVAKLAPDGVRGPAALVPPGSSAVAVPAPEESRPPLRRGDRVDVLAAADDGGTTVAAGALVVDVAEEVVTVAVPAEEAPAVAFAVARGIVVLALAP
jgi:Flp pilus assembly protein CpaB